MLAVLLGLALAVFVADRVFLGLSPSSAGETASSAAPQTPGPGPSTSGRSPQGAGAGLSLDAGPGLADRLEELAARHEWDAQTVRDAFRAPASWIAKPTPAVAKPNSDELRARRFRERYKLSATAVTGGGGIAIINGQCLAVGQELDGFKLVAVDRSSATFLRNKVRVRLALAQGTAT